jgi:serine/threonine protein kinase/tetratricopeptide (TPR) repeat protein
MTPVGDGSARAESSGGERSGPQIDTACDRFKDAWREGREPRIEDFVTVGEGLERPELLRELIALEIGLRKSRGETPTPQEYRLRFPSEASLVAAAFGETEQRPRPNVENALRSGLSELPAPDFRATLSDVAGQQQDLDGPDDSASFWGEPEPKHRGNRFQILRSHAKGGHGEVFVALDTELKREVAVKTIQSRYADDPRFRSRFLFEAEVTGSLEHPGIVPVYGLGRSQDGRPYYAMRLIEGKIQGSSLRDAIRRFHDAEMQPGREPGQSAIEFRELLERFIDVCDTIAYAHSRGVIHRDIKPSNIMLGPYGETLVVDWGLAKALGTSETTPPLGERASLSGLSADGSQTEPGSVLGTPSYMSPEQAQGDLEALGPRSDVYSLGATLYTLLTGAAPYRAGRAGATAAAQAANFPPPRKIRPAIDPALEAVCQQAMAFRSADRYESARALADDLRHWTAGEPVSAWREPPSRRMRRWARSHRTAVTAAAIGVFVALAASIIIAAIQGQAANRERLLAGRERQARVLAQSRLGQVQKANALLSSIFNDLDPRTEEAGGKPLRAILGERLKKAAESKELEAIGDPLAVATMQHVLGSSLTGFGDTSEAIALLTRAYDTRAAQLGPDHPDTLATRNNLAVAYINAGHPAQAVPILEANLKASVAVLGPDDQDTLRRRGNLASAYHDVGRTSDAIKIDEETLRICEKKLGPDHADTLSHRNNLAADYHKVGRYDEAAALLELILKSQSAKLGPDHPQMLITRYNLTEAYCKAGKATDAVRMGEAVVKGYEARVGNDNPDTLDARRILADCYYEAGRYDDAIATHARTLKELESKVGPDHPYTINCRAGLAEDYKAVGRVHEAISLFQTRLKSQRSSGGAEHPDTLVAMNDLAGAYLKAKQFGDAEKLVRECLALRNKIRPDEWRRFWAESQLGAALAGQKKFAAAEPYLIKGYEGLKERESRLPSQGKRELKDAAARIVPLYEAWQKPDKAAEWKKRLAR